MAKIGNTNRKGKKHPHSEETKKKISLTMMGNKNCLGRKLSEEHKRKISEAKKGKSYLDYNEEWRKKMSDAQKRRVANGTHNFWKGGVTSKNIILRRSLEHRLWRKSVFARDNWICQKCKERGGNLHPHHIQNFAQFPELRFAIDNGITLCKKCHILFHHTYGKKNNNINQISDFTKSLYKTMTKKQALKESRGRAIEAVVEKKTELLEMFAGNLRGLKQNDELGFEWNGKHFVVRAGEFSS